MIAAITEDNQIQHNREYSKGLDESIKKSNLTKKQKKVLLKFIKEKERIFRMKITTSNFRM